MDIEIKTEEEIPEAPKVRPVRRRKPSTTSRRRVKRSTEPSEQPIVFVAPSLVHQTPSSSSRIYGRIALGFSLVSLLLLGGLLTLATQEATITVKATRQPINTSFSIKIQSSKNATVAPASSLPVVPGTVVKLSHTAEQSFQASLGKVAGGVSTGVVTLINNFSKNQPLVARTRLLSKEGVLFRISKGVTVPAKGTLQVTVVADKEGPEGDIPATTFTIPGLWTGLQDKIYAKSDAPMQGGSKQAPMVTQSDVERAKETVSKQATAEALAEFTATYGAPTVSVTEIMSVATQPKVGTAVTTFTTRVTIEVLGIIVDRAAILAMARKNLTASLKPDTFRTISTVREDSLKILLEDYDAKTNTARLKVYLEGETTLSPIAPVLDTRNIVGRSKTDALSYFSQLKEITNTNIKLYPFWNTRIPVNTANITVEVQ